MGGHAEQVRIIEPAVPHQAEAEEAIQIALLSRLPHVPGLVIAKSFINSLESKTSNILQVLEQPSSAIPPRTAKINLDEPVAVKTFGSSLVLSHPWNPQTHRRDPSFLSYCRGRIPH
jgi:hypothetical protein